MTSQSLNPEILFGFVLLLVGLLGAGASILHNISAARGPRERAFLARASLGIALVFFCLLSLMYHLDTPWRWIALLFYLGLMPVMIYRCSLRRHEIREEEGVDANEARGGT